MSEFGGAELSLRPSPLVELMAGMGRKQTLAVRIFHSLTPRFEKRLITAWGLRSPHEAKG